MATMTVTNTTNTVGLPSRTIHTPAEYYGKDIFGTPIVPDPLLGTALLTAQSSGLYGNDKGHKTDRLPYPFSHTDELAAGAARTLAVHPIDFTKQIWWETHSPATEWNQLVQQGVVSVAFAAEAGVTDVFEDLISTV